MQYGLIFESAKVRSSFEMLSRQQKVFVVAAYLYRQLRLIKSFDRIYSERLSELFVRGLSVAVEGTSDLIRSTQEEVEDNIPDTEEFSAQEGSFAQNLMIALNYLLLFLVYSDYSSVQRCVDMFLQNMDLINYEVDEDYDEDQLVLKEVEVAFSLVENVSVAMRNTPLNIDTLKLIARPHLV